MSSQRKSYTFKEGLTMMAAKAVGIDPEQAAVAGESARAAISAIRNAQKTEVRKDRERYIRDARSELRNISAETHGPLVNALNAKLLALQGRGGDTEIAHLTPGEVVLPNELQTPKLMNQIRALAARKGIDPASLSVLSHANNINPSTGQREFQGGHQEIIVPGFRPKPVSIHRMIPGIDLGFAGLEDDAFATQIQNQVASNLNKLVENAQPYDQQKLDEELKKESIENLEKLRLALNDAAVTIGYVAIAAGGLTLIMASPGWAFLIAVGFGVMALGANQLSNAIDRVITASGH